MHDESWRSRRTARMNEPLSTPQPAYMRAGASLGAQTVRLGETRELELALELLEVSSEAELEQFLGNIFKGIKKIGKKVARPLGGVLKTVAKTALPFVGGALGSFIPIPGVGTALGTALGSAVGSALEIELEGVDGEIAQLEMAQRFVRFAADAAARAANEAEGGMDPNAAVKAAVIAAARSHVPALGDATRHRSPSSAVAR